MVLICSNAYPDDAWHVKGQTSICWNVDCVETSKHYSNFSYILCCPAAQEIWCGKTHTQHFDFDGSINCDTPREKKMHAHPVIKLNYLVASSIIHNCSILFVQWFVMYLYPTGFGSLFSSLVLLLPIQCSERSEFHLSFGLRAFLLE